MKKSFTLLFGFIYILSIFLGSCSVESKNNLMVPEQYTVSFSINDSSENPEVKTQIFIEGKQQKLKSITELGFAREDYIFLGWSKKADSKVPEYKDEAKYTATEDITLYAIWKEIPKYIVSFNINDSSENPEVKTQIFKDGKPQKLKSVSELGFTREGYVFLGWSINSDSEYQDELDETLYSATKDIVFYAIWKALPKYTVTFDINDGTTNSLQKTQSFTYETLQNLTAIEELNFAREDYVFLGWSINSDSVSPDYPDQTEFIATEDIILYAIWGAVPKYTVTFDINGGASTVVSKTQIFTEGKPQELTSITELGFTREDYNFVGWSTNSSSSHAEYTDEAIYEASGDIILYAIWSHYPVYSVSFDSDGGSRVNAQSIISGKKVIRPTDPTKDKYKFLGWYLGDDEYNFEMAVTTPITLKAKWQLITYTVTFDSGEGSSVEAQIITTGGLVTKPVDPTRDGYEFMGWYLNGEKYYFTTLVTTNITLTAKWECLYLISLNTPQNGSLFLNSSTGKSIKGKSIVLQIVPNMGYVIDSVSISDTYDNNLDFTIGTPYKNWNLNLMQTDYTFAMPESNVNIFVSFKKFVYQFHETVEVLPEGTDGTHGSEATYVYFGDYPQTIKPTNVELTSTTKIWNDGTYVYLGSDGYWYKMITENAYTYGGHVETYSDFAGYGYVGRKKDLTPLNTQKYFKIEPVKWYVAETKANGEKTLISETILMSGIKYSTTDEVRSLDNKTVYPNNYEYSNIRTWLQTVFLSTAFSTEAQGLISTTAVNNNGDSISLPWPWNTQSVTEGHNYWDTKFICQNTSDKIFLLGAIEWQSYIGTDIELKATDFAKANYLCGTRFLLRSPVCYNNPNETHYNKYYVTTVQGSYSNYGDIDMSPTKYDNAGIVPALNIVF